jgi:transcriptional regulator with XRE-family HTH domain
MQANQHAIIDLRRARGYTQAELARRAGISKQVLSNVERGRSVRPRPSTIASIAAALDAHLTEITVGDYSGDPQARRAIIRQLSNDGLSVDQIARHLVLTRHVVASDLKAVEVIP